MLKLAMSSWLLRMSWCQIGCSRTSATTILIGLQWNITWIILCNTNISLQPLTHWGWVANICVSTLIIITLIIIGSDNSLSPDRRQAIIWTNAGILIGPVKTNFSEIRVRIQTFSLKKIHLKMLSAKWHPFFLGLNMLNKQYSRDIRRLATQWFLS